MRVLALDTSTGCGSLALLEDDAVIYQSRFAEGQRTAQTFSVALDDALRRVAWEPRSIGLVATTNGPGSFTGLRISVTVAKFFAYATRANLIALNTLDVIVEQLPREVTSACVLIDAQRRQLFVGIYQRATEGKWQALEPCQIMDRDKLAARLAPPTVLSGPALSRLPVPFFPGEVRADPACWSPHAATVGVLGWHAYQAGLRSDIWQLQPRYYRPSYAEEK
jgi:tRNA threonylcarbamoyladenosine biosynthesis protein TsaB